MPKWTRGRVSTNEAVVETARDLFGGAAESWNETVDTVTEKATAIVETAKETVTNTIIPGLSEGLNALGKAARKAIPTALAASATKEYMGGQGSFIEFMQPAYLYTSFQRMEDERHEYIGWICHRVLSLSTLSGFTMCENVQLEIADATVDELQLIKQFLEAGAYIE